ncbi:SsrA-binding protein [Candidatus Magnetomoraceae bacterium gMMP-15]
MKDDHIKIITVNRKARHEYFIDKEYEAGMVLSGTEVKALRTGRANIKDAYVNIKNNEPYVQQMYIGEYPFAAYGNHNTLRPRKLLLHKYEIKKLIVKTREKGFSIIPLKLYFKNGKVKITIAFARGKRKYDKRETIKKRDEKREMDRLKRKKL